MPLSADAIQSYNAGTLAGAGSFYCETCGFAIALHERDQIPACPHCNGLAFKRASIFGFAPAEPVGTHHVDEPPAWLAQARSEVGDSDSLAYAEGAEGEHRAVAVEEEFLRIGRSLAAEVRFDDPTVSRRHAILHRHERGVRILDDRSLNGVFVNGERTEWHSLEDGDEILVGRFRLYFMTVAGTRDPASGTRTGADERAKSAVR